jgi:AraC-like DNA-binding protein
VQPKQSDAQFLRISSADLPERDRIEAFREVFGRTILNIEMNPLGGQSLDVEMTLRGLDGFGMASGRLSPMRNRHLAGLSDNDDLVLVVLEAGRGVAEQCGREAAISDGEAVLTANGKKGIFTGHSETSLVNFRLDRTRLSSRVQDLDAALAKAIPRETAGLRLLVNYGGILADSDALATPELRHAVVDHMHDLAALVLGCTHDAGEIAQRRGVRAARLRALKADVRNTVHAQDLSIAAVAKRHGVSPRYVQMLFDLDGTTFSEFVLSERLSRAHRLLVDPRYLHLKVSEIAYSAGFSDLSYFNRTFRLRFGDTPSGVRAGRRLL